MDGQTAGDWRVGHAIEAIDSHIRAGRYAEALREVDANAELLVEWGVDLPLERLEGWLGTLEEHDPDDPWLMLLRGWAASTQRRHTLALVTLKKAERRFDALFAEGSAEWLRSRFLTKVAEGVTCEREGLYEPARAAFEAALGYADIHVERPLSTEEQRWVDHDPAGFFRFSLQAARLYRELGLKVSTARAYHNLGTRLIDRGEPLPARRFLESALELKTGAGNRVALANTLNSLGHAERHLGLWDRAAIHQRQALGIAEEMQHDWLRSYALNNLAEVRRDEGRFDDALDLYARSVEIKQATNNVFGLAHTYASRADLHLARGDPAAAKADADRAVALRLPTPDRYEHVRLLGAQIRATFALEGDAARAIDDLRPLVAELTAIDAKGELAVALWWSAAASQKLGRDRSLRRDVARSLALVEAYGSAHQVAPAARLHRGPMEFARTSRRWAAVARVVADAVDRGQQGREATERSRPVAAPVATPGMEVRMFGDLRITIDGREVPTWRWRSRKAVSVLAFLLHHRGAAVHREVAMETFWPEVEPARATKHLNVALSAVRRGLEEARPGAAACIQRTGAVYRIRPEVLTELDVRRFERLAGVAVDHAQRGDLVSAASAAEAAIAIAADDYLASEPYAEWAAAERDRLRGITQDLRASAAEWHLHAGQTSHAVTRAREVVAREPWRERAWQTLILAHRALGDRAAALQAYAECRAALLDELGVAPSDELVALGETLHR